VESDPDNVTHFETCVVRSDFAGTTAPKEAILRELERCGFCTDATFAIKLALEEAVANAINHGNGRDPDKRITIKYAIDCDRAVICISDEGNGFAHDSIPDPTTPERLSLPSGRGIMLMRAYMDEVTYRKEGREVCFVKQRVARGDVADG